MIRVDAHHHVWRLDRGDYDWITPDMSIHRDYGLDDLRPLLGDIDSTVLVQAAPTEAETDYLLEVARESRGLVKGVVGWIDLRTRCGRTHQSASQGPVDQGPPTHAAGYCRYLLDFS